MYKLPAFVLEGKSVDHNLYIIIKYVDIRYAVFFMNIFINYKNHVLYIFVNNTYIRKNIMI